ncbi:GTPase Era [Dietzia aerolata]|uniref:GTPase Era n=1 Tax=Dietzia aerolata TaxID=595984 RepID=A0ABV5JLH4_9ACTN|nr:GTPase Era [Dietzia aerolata]MBB0969979.1 GTPase Era [Dietzia aerolata]HIW67078.1 GTPase Era [Candidatus Dietzia merdigallinarum]
MSTPEGFRSGFVSFVGRPNTGKSTLTNALVGEKIAITSSRPQTTRHAIRGIVHREDSQIILVDTPGLHRPRTLLGERLNALVEETFSDVDLIGMCFPAGDRIGPGDKWILEQVRSLCPGTPVMGLVTKIDSVSKQKVMEQLVAVSKFLGPDAEVVPVSAVSGEQVDVVAEVIASLLPEGPQFYPDDIITEETDESRMAELIREAALEGVRDELPHSIAVTIEEVLPHEGRDDMVDVHATVYVERQSQKAIVLGPKGARMRDVGTQARAGIEKLLGTRVYLDLHVKVLKEWQRDPKMLGRLGF